jgi:hypothetical protein
LKTGNTETMNTPDVDEAEPNIAADLVGRVSQRRALGIPLRIALAGERVNCKDYETYLSENSELAELEDVARQKFLEHALSVMLNGKDAAANFRWLIGRVYPEVIGSPREEESEEEHQTIRGVPEYLVDEARRQAQAVSPNPPPYN